MPVPRTYSAIADFQESTEAERELIESARAGRLSEHLESAQGHGRQALYSMMSRVVFQCLTRPVELRRGHPRCAAGPAGMAEDCHDRHQDDVAALHAHLLRHAGQRFENLEGWLASRATRASIDAYRERRAERGALTRPRLTVWLARQLGENEWHRTLALNILEWVGVTATAGPLTDWPLGAWAQQRTRFEPGPEFTEVQVAEEVEHILRTMRTRPKWYADYVERPLGRKQAPLVPAQRPGGEDLREPEYVASVEPDEAQDALLTELATAAITSIGTRLARGQSAREAVAEVIGTVFGVAPETGAEQMDRTPDRGQEPDAAECAARLILVPEVLDRVVDTVLELIAQLSP